MLMMAKRKTLYCHLKPAIMWTTQQLKIAKNRDIVLSHGLVQQQLLQAATTQYSQCQRRHHSTVAPYQVKITICQTMGAAQSLMERCTQLRHQIRGVKSL